MNITHKNRLPPSPSSTICRKPLFNLTNILSADLTNKTQKNQVYLGRPSPTKNTRTSAQGLNLNTNKIPQALSRKSSIQKNCLSSSVQYTKKCKNHKTRTAMHSLTIQNQTQNYCFECSLFYAKQGYKIKSIAKQISDQTVRQKQMKQFIEKCMQIQGQVMYWKKQQNSVVKQIYEEYAEIIDEEKNKLQEEVKKLREFYGGHIKKIQQAREMKINRYREVEQQIEKLSKKLETTKTDIQTNYQDCLKSFSMIEFRTVMDQYWKQLDTSQQFILSNSISSLTKKSHSTLKRTAKTLTNSNNSASVTDFTFSKQHKKQKQFDSPPLHKQIQGIKLVESHPDSNRYSSSMRESIVDNKFTFSSQFMP